MLAGRADREEWVIDSAGRGGRYRAEPLRRLEGGGSSGGRREAQAWGCAQQLGTPLLRLSNPIRGGCGG